MIAEIPFGIVAIHIEFAERRSAVTYGYQNQFLVSSRHFFGHDPVGAVCQLVDSPQLFGAPVNSGTVTTSASAVAASARLVPSITIL